MRKLILLAAVLSTTFYACEKAEKNEIYPNHKNVALSSNLNSSLQSTSSEFVAELVSSNQTISGVEGYAWTWEVKKLDNETGLSHFNFIDGVVCEDLMLSDHIVGAQYSQDAGSTWNNVELDWKVDPSTNGAGGNSVCYSGQVLKIDAGGDNLLVRLIMDAEYGIGTQHGVFKRGNGNPNSGLTGCGIIEFEGPTCLPLEDDACFDWQEETAWSAGSRYNTRGNWSTYSSKSSLETENGVKLYAGQTIEIGTVKLTNGTLTITLTNGWELVPDTDAVKIQGYNATPSGNPSPGQFTTYKGSSLTPSISSSNFYGIHLDVRKWVEVPCE